MLLVSHERKGAFESRGRRNFIGEKGRLEEQNGSNRNDFIELSELKCSHLDAFFQRNITLSQPSVHKSEFRNVR
jgi:hypothetical protein